MTSIERTAYPRFQQTLSQEELDDRYGPTEEHLDFVRAHARGQRQRLTLLMLLQCFRQLGYAPDLATIPDQIRRYLCGALHLPETTQPIDRAGKTVYRYHQAVRSYLGIRSFSDGGEDLARAVVETAAQMSSAVSAR